MILLISIECHQSVMKDTYLPVIDKNRFHYWMKNSVDHFVKKDLIMDDTITKRNIMRAVILACIPACLTAVVLYKMPVKDFLVSAILENTGSYVSGHPDVKPDSRMTDRLKKDRWMDLFL